MLKMKDVANLSIEQIIRLPYFLSLEKLSPDAAKGQITATWKITFRCNKTTATGWQLLDELSDNECIVRYKLIDFNF